MLSSFLLCDLSDRCMRALIPALEPQEFPWFGDFPMARAMLP